MRADGCAFFDHGDLDVADFVRTGGFVVLFDETREVRRAPQISWTSTDEYDVEF